MAITNIAYSNIYTYWDCSTDSTTTTTLYTPILKWYSTETTCATTNWELDYSFNFTPTKTPTIRDIIKQRIFPHIKTNRQYLDIPSSNSEIKARQTLRMLIGEEQYKYLSKNGFISVQADSGRIYCIYPGYNLTKVYYKGKLVEKLCVVLSGELYPPCDHLMVRYLLIKNDEDLFRSKAIKRCIQYHNRTTVEPEDKNISLVEIYKQYAAAA